MTTAERIDALRRHGFPPGVIAAVLGVDHAAVADFLKDPAEVPSLPSGGSAFAHLTEDTDNSRIVADWPLVFGDPATPFLKVDPTDGSLHWGNDATSFGLARGYMVLNDGGNGLQVTQHPEDVPGHELVQLTSWWEDDPLVPGAKLPAVVLHRADGNDSVVILADGTIELTANGGDLTLGVDATSHLTVNGSNPIISSHLKAADSGGPNSYNGLWSDHPLATTSDLSGGPFGAAKSSAILYPNGTLELFTAETYVILGTLALPDASGDGLQANGGFMAGTGQGAYSYLSREKAFITDGADTLTVDPGSGVDIDKSGGYLKLRSIGGVPYLITVSDAGALVVDPVV